MALKDAVGEVPAQPYHSIHEARWEFRHRRARGLADAFRRAGRKILISPTKRAELIAKQPAA
jgi:hypothetical protein